MNDDDTPSASSKEQTPAPKKTGLLGKVIHTVQNVVTHINLDEWVGKDDSVDQDGRKKIKTLMLRRKQNDFVRNREFDQLRRIRNKKNNTSQSMLPQMDAGLQDAREDSLVSEETTEKIDAIEAQFSDQWVTESISTTPQPPGFPQHKSAVADTKSSVMGVIGSPSEQEIDLDNLLTLPGEDMRANKVKDSTDAIKALEIKEVSVEIPAPAPSLEFARLHDEEAAVAPQMEKTADGQTKHLNDLSSALQMAPYLENAALLFAASNDDGCERILIEGIKAQPERSDSYLSGLLFLEDFYGVLQREEDLIDLYKKNAILFSRGANKWITYTPQGNVDTKEIVWHSPEVLSAESILKLTQATRQAYSMHQMLTVNWGSLQIFSSDVLSVMVAWVKRLLGLDLDVQFINADRLEAALAELGKRQVNCDTLQYWLLRQEVAKCLNRPEEFDRLSASYAKRWQIPKPQWTTPIVRVIRIENRMEEKKGSFDLNGSLTGDITATLTTCPINDGGIVLDCRALVRIDFAAAGSLLSWVRAHKEKGREIHVRQVHRLVAALFALVGLADLAKISLRI